MTLSASERVHNTLCQIYKVYDIENSKVERAMIQAVEEAEIAARKSERETWAGFILTNSTARKWWDTRDRSEFSADDALSLIDYLARGNK